MDTWVWAAGVRMQTGRGGWGGMVMVGAGKQGGGGETVLGSRGGWWWGHAGWMKVGRERGGHSLGSARPWVRGAVQIRKREWERDGSGRCEWKTQVTQGRGMEGWGWGRCGGKDGGRGHTHVA